MYNKQSVDSNLNNALANFTEIKVLVKNTYADCMPATIGRTQVCRVEYNMDTDNRPASSYNYVVTSTRYDSSQGVQIAQGSSSGVNYKPNAYIRFMNNNEFNKWQKLTTETDLAGCTFSINNNVLSITNGTETWTLTSN